MIFTLKHLGFVLMSSGAALLAALLLRHFTAVNILLIVPLAMIVGGLVIYVWGQKRESRY